MSSVLLLNNRGIRSISECAYASFLISYFVISWGGITSVDKARAVFGAWQEHVLYLINKNPVCSRSWGDFPSSAVGG